jgi:hypothetical protein
MHLKKDMRIPFCSTASTGLRAVATMRMAHGPGLGEECANPPFLACSRLLENRKTRLGEKPVYLRQILHYLKHYGKILRTAASA